MGRDKENKKEIMKLKEEYIAKEYEVRLKIYKTIIERVLKGNDEVSPLDFYPEYDLNSKKPYTCHEFGKPLWILLPHFKSVIVDIYPYYSEPEFERKYEVNVDQLLQLQKDGRVLLRLYLPVREEISDYLLPVYEEGLQKGFPTFHRIYDFVHLTGGKAFEEGWKEGEKLFKGKLKQMALEIRKPWECITELERDLEYVGIFEYAHLKAFGFQQLTEKLKDLAKLDPALASCVSSAYSTFLVEPTISSLDGIHLVNREDIQFLSDVISDFKFPKPNLDSSLTTAKYEVFPYEIGRSLVENAKLVVPNNLEHALDVYPDYEKARKALKELELAVEEKGEKLKDRVAALEEVWRDMKSIETTARRIKIILGVAGSTISAMTGGFLAGFPGLLAGLFGGLVSTDFIATRVGKKFAKIGKGSNIVAIYDFVKTATKSRRRFA